MKPVSPLNLAQSPGVPDDNRKLSLALSINLPPPKKDLQKNLLENSLTSKLKQHRHDFSSNKENLSRAQNTKPPKSKRQFRSTASGSNKPIQQTPLPRSNSVSFVDRNESAASSGKSAKNEILPAKVRIDSAASDQLPKLATRKESSSTYNPSRRSSSAEPILGRRSFHSGTTRMTSASSFFHSSDSSGLAFESRGADYTIKVVKKDGVFQPIDKYASSRFLSREFGQDYRSMACDYQMFTLPVTCEDSEILKPNPRDHFTDGNRRPLKVSWSKTMDSTTNEEIMEGLESRMESAPPVTPNNLIRAMSSSSFKRPIYSSGKSQVQSIGLRWRVPTVPPDEEEIILTEQSPSKPMWSWLVTPEAKHKGKLKTERQLKRGSKNSSLTCLNRVNSNLDVRIQHSRDLHPVSTAMAREGTSVSKTKWLVPSSSGSTQEGERLAMDRLEMVKRERKIRADTNDVDENYRIIRTNVMDDNESEEDEDDIGHARRHMDDTGTTSYGSKSNIDTIISPAKSRSTFNQY